MSAQQFSLAAAVTLPVQIGTHCPYPSSDTQPQSDAPSYPARSLPASGSHRREVARSPRANGIRAIVAVAGSLPTAVQPPAAPRTASPEFDPRYETTLARYPQL